MNGDGPRRRRRSSIEPASGGRLPLFPLFIVVVLAGLALGALISQSFNRKSSAPQFAIHTATAAPPITPAPIHRASLKSAAPKPSRMPLPTTPASAMPSAPAQLARSAKTPATPRPVRRVALTTPRPSAKALAAPIATSPPTIRPASAARPVAHAAASLPPTGVDAAAAVARDYLSALMRGDDRTANSALGKPPGSLPNFSEQPFLTPQSRITNLHATSNGDGTYKVEAEVASAKGTYFVTFQVSRNVGAYYITDHYAIKVQ